LTELSVEERRFETKIIGADRIGWLLQKNNMKTLLQNHTHRTILEDRQGKKLFYIYSNRILNNNESVDAARDKSRHVSATRRPHPEYNTIWEIVDVHFCAPQLN